MAHHRLLIAALVLTTVASGQAPLLDEDFAGTLLTTPPPGWSITTHQGAPADGFRFDNPASRTIPGPLQAPVAIVDSDFAGIVPVDSELFSPVFDASGSSALELRWDQLHVPLASTVEVAVITPQGRFTVHGPTTAGDVAPRSFAIDITAACNGSSSCRVSWRYAGTFDWYWEIDNVEVRVPSTIDLGVTALTRPAPTATGCTALGAAETVAVDVTNFGAAAIPSGTTLPVSYVLNAGAPVSESFVLGAALAPGAVTNLIFATAADLSQSSSHTLDATVTLGGDSNPANDALTGQSIEGPLSVTSYPWVEDFDALAPFTTAPPPGWINDDGDVPGAPGFDDWIAYVGATPSAGTGPAGDHTSGAGIYLYVEDSFPGDHAAVNLLSPCLDLTPLAAPALEFHYHGLNVGPPSEENGLALDVISFPSGAVTLEVAPTLGDTGVVSWVAVAADLSPFAGGVVRLRFRASTANSGGFGHDLALDDVRVLDFLPGPGQPPSPGVAVLDVNDAREGNGLPVAAGFPGPYAAAAATGGSIRLVLGGEAHRPVVLFTGPSNPGFLDFGPVGTLDLGSPDGVGGASGITIVGDGAGGDLVSSLFVIPPSGAQAITFTAPATLSGAVIPLQMLAPHSTAVARLSNSVVLTIT